MSHSASTASPHSADSHGHEEGHSHHIVGPLTLRTILAFLLMFTFLTVAFAELEIYLEHALHIALPWWVNVIGAMSIAVVKSLLVMAYFMQLRYDNPINTVAMLFCFFALGLFLMFTGLDLFTRGWVYDFKSGPVVAGGTGKGVTGANDQPMVTAAKVRFKELLGENDVREWLICADTIRTAAEEAAEEKSADSQAAAAALNAHADHMMDLHVVKAHPPHGPSQALVARELEQLASNMRSGGKAGAADIIANASKAVGAINLTQAKATYSVEATFEKLAAVAHGGHHEEGGASSTGDVSRAQTGLSGALDASGHHHKVAEHSGVDNSAANEHSEGGK